MGGVCGRVFGCVLSFFVGAGEVWGTGSEAPEVWGEAWGGGSSGGGSDGWSGIGVYCHPPHSSCHPRFALLITSRAIQSPHVNTAPSPTPTHTPLTLPHTLTIAPPHSPPPSFSPHPPSPGYMNGILRQLQVARRRQRGTRLLGLGLVVGAVVGAGALAWMRR